MTKEELEKEAKEYVCKRNPLVTKEWFIDAFKKYNKGEKVKYLKDCEIAEYEAYLAGAEPREKRIAELERKLEQTEKDLADYQFNYPTIKELEAQIEKMKCCENCRYCNKWGEANSNSPNCKKCNWVSNWKLRR